MKTIKQCLHSQYNCFDALKSDVVMGNSICSSNTVQCCVWSERGGGGR